VGALPVHPPITAYIGLGANTGARETNIQSALSMLRETQGISLQRVSTLLENPAVGMENAPAFLNGVAKIETTLSPESLLRRLLKIEKALGRTRRAKWEPRPIDLDILFYGQEIISTPTLNIPHPLMHERRFVLHPLTEIAPDAVHPALEKTAAQLLEELT
jgi:2-amino-4-hydroxy-6-hydroxymethyldihydropteridine diphosphokinase